MHAYDRPAASGILGCEYSRHTSDRHSAPHRPTSAGRPAQRAVAHGRTPGRTDQMQVPGRSMHTAPAEMVPADGLSLALGRLLPAPEGMVSTPVRCAAPRTRGGSSWAGWGAVRTGTWWPERPAPRIGDSFIPGRFRQSGDPASRTGKDGPSAPSRRDPHSPPSHPQGWHRWPSTAAASPSLLPAPAAPEDPRQNRYGRHPSQDDPHPPLQPP